MRTIGSSFDPVLPDELFVSVGEKVYVLLSYDDSWCVVRCDRSGVPEQGLVPSTCWDELYSGKIPRPMREVSLGGDFREQTDAAQIGVAL